MSIVSTNIRTLRKQMGFTQEQFAERIGIKRSLLGAYEEGRADPRLNNLQNIATEFGVTVDMLLTRDLTRMSREDIQKLMKKETGNGKEKLKILSITVDQQNRENIELVPQKAAAGYLNGFADPEYLEELPRFQLPLLPQTGTYRAFEISGDSMLPLPSGTIIIGQYVESARDIREGKTYIFVTAKEGVVYKRAYKNGKDNSLLMVSDNTAYAPFEVELADILEIWEAKAFISMQFPEPATAAIQSTAPGTGNLKSSTKPDMSLEKLAGLVLELQNEVIKLKEK
ncbi:LexA family transcriptional regulator [Cesiribacter sp. SM1]|uniref:XRE family transcriptional regulator n=1 Tax=Cesiribacter sp. SM1 TaxID=2861196 RepID=UPI001CD6AEB4|nr:LexA family transcriptional regulator [Cesiribacter sp. SM1]